jgi:hypothetical protein
MQLLRGCMAGAMSQNQLAKIVAAGTLSSDGAIPMALISNSAILKNGTSIFVDDGLGNVKPVSMDAPSNGTAGVCVDTSTVGLGSGGSSDPTIATATTTGNATVKEGDGEEMSRLLVALLPALYVTWCACITSLCMDTPLTGLKHIS